MLFLILLRLGRSFVYVNYKTVIINTIEALGMKRKKRGMICIRNAREAAKLNKYQMSRRLGVNQTSLTYMESKAKTARPDIIVRAFNVARKAGISLETFWDWYRADAERSAEAVSSKTAEVVEAI